MVCPLDIVAGDVPVDTFDTVVGSPGETVGNVDTVEEFPLATAVEVVPIEEKDPSVLLVV